MLGKGWAISVLMEREEEDRSCTDGEGRGWTVPVLGQERGGGSSCTDKRGRGG